MTCATLKSILFTKKQFWAIFEMLQDLPFLMNMSLRKTLRQSEKLLPIIEI